jgi:hypothetical protein
MYFIHIIIRYRYNIIIGRRDNAWPQRSHRVNPKN